MAQDKLNADLASKRGKAIRSHLVNRGGVEGRRVFVSELPESALPRLTGDEVREQRNRTVELLVGRVADGTAKP